MEANQTRIFFPHLDGIRFIAFLAVFINHAAGILHFYDPNGTWNFIRSNYLQSGDLGVNLFFVLSGFLITYLLLKEKELNGRIHIPHFYLRRILRIWPVYYFVALICLWIMPLFAKVLPPGFPIPVDTDGLSPWFYATFTGNFDYIYNGITNVLIGILWSVSVEEQFYLFWPLFIAFIRRRYLLFTFLTVIAGSIAFRYFGCDGGSAMLIRYHSLSCMSDLAVGAVFALLCTNARFAERLKRMPRWLIVFIYLLFIALIPFRNYLWMLDVHYVLVTAVAPVIFSLFFAFFIMEQNYAECSFYKFGRFRLISRLGRYTYGMYCYHMLVFFFTLYALYCCGLDVIHPSLFVFLTEIMVSLACTILSARFSYLYIERGFLRMKDHFATIVRK